MLSQGVGAGRDLMVGLVFLLGSRAQPSCQNSVLLTALQTGFSLFFSSFVGCGPGVYAFKDAMP
jgi:hypothetical protein